MRAASGPVVPAVDARALGVRDGHGEDALVELVFLPDGSRRDVGRPVRKRKSRMHVVFVPVEYFVSCIRSSICRACIKILMPCVRTRRIFEKLRHRTFQNSWHCKMCINMQLRTFPKLMIKLTHSSVDRAHVWNTQATSTQSRRQPEQKRLPASGRSDCLL